MGTYLRTVRGYNGGWSADSSDLKVSNGSAFNSALDGFYSNSSDWKRFYTSIAVISYTNYANFGSVFQSAHGFAEYTFYSNGHATFLGGASITDGDPADSFSESGRWDTTSVTPDISDFEIYATRTSSLDNVNYGTYNTWLNCSTTRTWGGNTNPTNSGTYSVDFQLRHIPSNDIVSSWTATAVLTYNG